jgi:hypothetical protein
MQNVTCFAGAHPVPLGARGRVGLIPTSPILRRLTDSFNLDMVAEPFKILGIVGQQARDVVGQHRGDNVSRYHAPAWERIAQNHLRILGPEIGIPFPM